MPKKKTCTALAVLQPQQLAHHAGLPDADWVVRQHDVAAYNAKHPTIVGSVVKAIQSKIDKGAINTGVEALATTILGHEATLADIATLQEKLRRQYLNRAVNLLAATGVPAVIIRNTTLPGWPIIGVNYDPSSQEAARFTKRYFKTDAPDVLLLAAGLASIELKKK